MKDINTVGLSQHCSQRYTNSLVLSTGLKWLVIGSTMVLVFALLFGISITSYFFPSTSFNTSDCSSEPNGILAISVIALYYPPKMIGNFAVAVYCVSKLFWGSTYYYVFRHTTTSRQSRGCWYKVCNRFCFAQNFGEMLGIFVVMFVSIDDHFAFHVAGFVGYVTAVCCYMVSITSLYYMSGMYKKNEATFYARLVITITVLTLCFVMALTFLTYKSTCMAWAYYVFVLMEYSTFLLSSAFHCLMYFDLKDFKVKVYLLHPERQQSST